MGLVNNPVTQVALVAVKSASKNGKKPPSLLLIGSHNKTAPLKITNKKVNAILRAGDKRRYFSLMNVIISIHLLRTILHTFLIFSTILRRFNICKKQSHKKVNPQQIDS